MRKVYGIGTTGKGKYNSVRDKDAHLRWRNMLYRCYSNYYRKTNGNKNSGAIVCNEWLNFQNFAGWYYDNHYRINNKLTDECHLDKDFLSEDIKIYSPETCIFLPSELNNAIPKNKQLKLWTNNEVDKFMDVLYKYENVIPSKVMAIIKGKIKSKN